MLDFFSFRASLLGLNKKQLAAADVDGWQMILHLVARTGGAIVETSSLQWCCCLLFSSHYVSFPYPLYSGHAIGHPVETSKLLAERNRMRRDMRFYFFYAQSTNKMHNTTILAIIMDENHRKA